MALAATLISSTRAIRQQAANDNPEQSQNVIFLGLGALLGVAYSLGTEKYMRAMQHRHIFVRNAMLWLSAVAWLFAVAAVAVVASLIYNQVGGNLEGFDRVFGVLIPFVVRADLIVDWAKRVAWALLNMATWTQGAIQIRRLISRAPAMNNLVSVDDEVTSMTRTDVSRQTDLLIAEDRVWTEDSDSLVRLSELLQHFEKLARVAAYAFVGLIGAIPGALVWITYATYHGTLSFRNSLHGLGTLYWLSVFLAPVGAVILIIASTILLCGVVTLSIVGTMIQFSVYWSTRTVYSMVRIALSQAWAGFPDITKPHAMPNVQHAPTGLNAGSMAVRAVRHPEEAGAAISLMGILLPTDLEFALASWDGTYKGDTSKPKPIGYSVSRHLRVSTYFGTVPDTQKDELTPTASNSASQDVPPNPTKSTSQHTNVSQRPSSSDADDDLEEENRPAPNGCDHVEQTPAESLDPTPDVKNNETILILLGRLGLDLSVKSARKRRLSTYYALGMLVHLQIESGGNAWRLHNVDELNDDEFEQRIARFNCIIADEAKVSIQELTSRLRGSSKYRVIPTGFPNSRMVPVNVWLRSVLLLFLETESESDGSRRLHSIPYP